MYTKLSKLHFWTINVLCFYFYFYFYFVQNINITIFPSTITFHTICDPFVEASRPIQIFLQWGQKFCMRMNGSPTPTKYVQPASRLVNYLFSDILSIFGTTKYSLCNAHTGSAENFQVRESSKNATFNTLSNAHRTLCFNFSGYSGILFKKFETIQSSKFIKNK